MSLLATLVAQRKCRLSLVILVCDIPPSLESQTTNSLLKLPELCTLKNAKTMHQYSHHTLPKPFFMFFTPIWSVHDQFTRTKTKNKLYIPKFSTARSQNYFKYQGAKIWNSIPTKIRQVTFHKFKIEYKKKLLKSDWFISLYFQKIWAFLYATSGKESINHFIDRDWRTDQTAKKIFKSAPWFPRYWKSPLDGRCEYETFLI